MWWSILCRKPKMVKLVFHYVLSGTNLATEHTIKTNGPRTGQSHGCTDGKFFLKLVKKLTNVVLHFGILLVISNFMWEYIKIYNWSIFLDFNFMLKWVAHKHINFYTGDAEMMLGSIICIYFLKVDRSDFWQLVFM